MSILLYRVNPEKNIRRYYRLDVQPDLFGHPCLQRCPEVLSHKDALLMSFIREADGSIFPGTAVVCEWGRIGRGGQTRIVPYPSVAEAQAACDKQRARKERKGYVAV